MGYNLQFERPDLITSIFPWGNNEPEYLNNLAWESKEKCIQIHAKDCVRNKESLLYIYSIGWRFQKDLPSLEVLPIFWEVKAAL